MEQIIITGVGSNMQGVGRLPDGRAVFVPGALPGERVSIALTRDSGKFCEGRVAEVLEASPHRVQPDCEYYGRCGGCQLRHGDYECAMAMKRTRVDDALRRIAGLDDPVVLETLGCSCQNRTRNKAEYPITNGVVGMRPEKGAAVIPISDCLLQHPLSIAVMQRAREYMKGSKINGWLVTRISRAGDMMVILSTDGRAPTWLSRLSSIEGVRSIYHCALKKRPAHALDGACSRVWGAAAITETLCGLDFQISPQTFFQVNTPQAERLYALALEAAGIRPDSRVLDAYCGCGTITLAAARLAGHALGVEIVPPAIVDAKRNAEANGLSGRTDFVCADAALEIPRRIKAGERFDSVIVDPPRKGCDRALVETLIQSPVPRIAYVSCDPGTLARDIKLLCAGGYRLEWARPVDMFPGTAHVETVCLLSKR
jgi:23S rRNA (uracil1939-C5)-methyltransferase